MTCEWCWSARVSSPTLSVACAGSHDGKAPRGNALFTQRAAPRASKVICRLRATRRRTHHTICHRRTTSLSPHMRRIRHISIRRRNIQPAVLHSRSIGDFEDVLTITHGQNPSYFHIRWLSSASSTPHLSSMITRACSCDRSLVVLFSESVIFHQMSRRNSNTYQLVNF